MDGSRAAGTAKPRCCGVAESRGPRGEPDAGPPQARALYASRRGLP